MHVALRESDGLRIQSEKVVFDRFVFRVSRVHWEASDICEDHSKTILGFGRPFVTPWLFVHWGRVRDKVKRISMLNTIIIID